MSDTPERIWLGQNMNGWIAIEYRPNWVQLPEYIRADRIEALQSEVESFRTAAAVAGPALQKALREIEALIAERDALAQKRNDAERVAGVLTLENEALQADNARLRQRIQNQTDQINGLERSRRRLESLTAGADRRVEAVEADNARLKKGCECAMSEIRDYMQEIGGTLPLELAMGWLSAALDTGKETK